jgi:hypothetical protein
VEYLRVKISQEDLRQIYGYLDKDGKGNIGYNEFCELCEERWTNLDPYKHHKAKEPELSPSEKPNLKSVSELAEDNLKLMSNKLKRLNVQKYSKKSVSPDKVYGLANELAGPAHMRQLV